MIKTFFAAFSLAGWATKLSVIAVAVLTLGTAYGIWHYKVWSRGYDRALADVAKQDQKAMPAPLSIAALFLTVALAGCAGTKPPASVARGECRVFEAPPYEVLGKTPYDQD